MNANIFAVNRRCVIQSYNVWMKNQKMRKEIIDKKARKLCLKLIVRDAVNTLIYYRKYAVINEIFHLNGISCLSR